MTALHMMDIGVALLIVGAFALGFALGSARP